MSWSGMRGAVSLAAALAVPLSTDAGDPFPGRDLIVFLTFSVILATLVLQGLTLGPLIAALRLRGEGEADKLAELRARLDAARVALDKLERLGDDGRVSPEVRRGCVSTTRGTSNATLQVSKLAAPPRNMRIVLRPGATGGASCSRPSAK